MVSFTRKFPALISCSFLESIYSSMLKFVQGMIPKKAGIVNTFLKHEDAQTMRLLLAKTFQLETTYRIIRGR
jgi:hypothetical protein